MIRLRTILVMMAFLALLVVGAGGCVSTQVADGAAPGTVWAPSASGLPTLYIFGDPS
jgi:hypothetical protein